jgi:hypothetical protein
MTIDEIGGLPDLHVLCSACAVPARATKVRLRVFVAVGDPAGAPWVNYIPPTLALLCDRCHDALAMDTSVADALGYCEREWIGARVEFAERTEREQAALAKRRHLAVVE